MTDIAKDIERAKELDRLATRGPWEDEPGYNNGGCPTRFFKIPGHQGGETVEILAADSLFCAESRTLLPQLVSEVERLSGELVTLKKETFRAWGAERLAEIARDAAIARAEKAEASRTPPEWRPLSVLTRKVAEHWKTWQFREQHWPVPRNRDLRSDLTNYEFGPAPSDWAEVVSQAVYGLEFPEVCLCRPVDREGVPVPWAEVGL